MTRLAKWVERHWHGPRTRRYDQKHHRPIHAAAVTTRRRTR